MTEPYFPKVHSIDSGLAHWWRMNRVPGSDYFIDFNINNDPAAGQDGNGTAVISQRGFKYTLTGNRWRAFDIPYIVDADTVVEFDFESTVEGEEHSFFFATNSADVGNGKRFKLFGTSSPSANTIDDFNDYTLPDGTKHYVIPVGLFYTGTFSDITFVMDDDASEAGVSIFSNFKISNGLVKMANDSRGIFHGELDAAVVPNWVSGIGGNALNFDGVDQRVNCGNPNTLDDITEFTASVFCKLDVVDTSTDSAFNKGSSAGSDQTFTIMKHSSAPNDSFRGRIRRTDDQAANIVWDQVLLVGVWYYVVLTYDGRVMRLYVNGSLVDSHDFGSVSGLKITPSHNIHIGRRNSSQYWPGAIQDARIYTRVQSLEEIKAIDARRRTFV